MGIRVTGVYDFEVRKNDTHTTFETVLTEKGKPIDLSASTTEVYLDIQKPNGLFLRIKAHKDLTVTGGIGYQWKEKTIDIPGIYIIEPSIHFGKKIYKSLDRIKVKVLDTITGA